MKTVSQIPKGTKGAWSTKNGVPFDCQLRKLRESHGVTLREVAKNSGVSVATIARMEWGSECQLSAALKLATFYETSVDKIWTLRKENK